MTRPAFSGLIGMGGTGCQPVRRGNLPRQFTADGAAGAGDDDPASLDQPRHALAVERHLWDGDRSANKRASADAVLRLLRRRLG